MASRSRPSRRHELKRRRDISYYIEIHSKKASRFATRNGKEDKKDEEQASSLMSSQELDADRYVKRSMTGCADATSVTKLDSQMKVHSIEETGVDSLGVAGSSDEAYDSEPARSSSETIPRTAKKSLKNIPKCISPAVTCRVKAKNSWKRHVLQCPSPPVTRQGDAKEGLREGLEACKLISKLPNLPEKSNGRLSTSELGPHANEDSMPNWLRELLLTDGKPKIVTKLLGDGRTVTTEVSENYVPNVIPVIEQLLEKDPSTDYAYTCDPSVVHISKLEKEGGFCGYRNIQMMISYMIRTRFPGYHHFEGKIPSIFQIQDMIENAWDNGINTHARHQTGGIRGSRKYIGTPEAQALYINLQIPCNAQALKRGHIMSAEDSLMIAVEQYFSGGFVKGAEKVQRTSLPPLYLQHPGHSMTIVGFEEKVNGSRELLVFDPIHHVAPGILELIDRRPPSKSNVKLLKTYRKGHKYLHRFELFEIFGLRTPSQSTFNWLHAVPKET